MPAVGAGCLNPAHIVNDETIGLFSNAAEEGFLPRPELEANYGTMRAELDSDKQDTEIPWTSYLKPAAGLYGVLFFWVGAWDLFASDWSFGNGTVWSMPYGDVTVQYLVYSFGGLFLTVITDTLYSSGALYGSLFPKCCGITKEKLAQVQDLKCDVAPQQIFQVFRAIVGMFGSVLMWVGATSIWGCAFPYATGWDNLLVFTGAVIAMNGLGIFWNYSGLAYPADSSGDTEEDPEAHTASWGQSCLRYWYFDSEETAPNSSSTCLSQACGITRAMLAFFTQCVTWNSWWMLVCGSGYARWAPVTGGVWQYLFYTSLGLLVVSAVNKLDTGFEAGDDEDVCGGKVHFVYAVLSIYLRALLALVAGLTHNTGMWVLANKYMWETSLARNMVYTALGLLGVLWSGQMFGLSGVTPIIIPKSDDHARAKETNRVLGPHRTSFIYEEITNKKDRFTNKTFAASDIHEAKRTLSRTNTGTASKAQSAIFSRDPPQQQPDITDDISTVDISMDIELPSLRSDVPAFKRCEPAGW